MGRQSVWAPSFNNLAGILSAPVDFFTLSLVSSFYTQSDVTGANSKLYEA